ncbi:tetratricopeptide repeat protein [Egicoccus halophilus]|uniref:Co-chaperone YbbN n=1 Tax=Egicoccus halophilus TaxID=1670830 RepID=A0A8J3A6E0_9ACTN|nr:tetratricopeptide repeat protein [Egicoccus halophilus]GGI04431.1 co-chaperone YbbN [Egicoccus halophilus]
MSFPFSLPRTDAGDLPLVTDVDQAAFETQVVERSHAVPVVVDFWAAWCGPCRTLGPMLEQAVQDRGGRVVLAKVDVDANQGLAQAFRVQGIPQVLGFRDGRVVASFTGAQPAAEIERFLDQLVPSEADVLVKTARALPPDQAEATLRQALEIEPGHREAAIGLAELLVERDPGTARELVAPHRPDPAAEAVLTRVDLADDHGDLAALQAAVERGDADGSTLVSLGRALAARGEYEAAIDRLLAAVELGGDDRETAREQLVALFGVLGDTDERVKAARPRLARALY